MDSKSQELYAEENRLALIELNKAMAELNLKYKAPVDAVVATIDNNVLDVHLNNKTLTVSLENEKDLEPALRDIAKQITSAVKSAKVDKVEVKGLATLKPKEAVKVSNFAKIEKLLGSILDKDYSFTVKQEAPKFPILAKDAIPVRLSDGKAFYKAQLSAVSSAIGETDPLVGYQPADEDVDQDPRYYGYTRKSGDWYIMELNKANGTYRYAVGAPQPRGGGLYTDAWTDRANLTYGYFHEVFNA